MSHFNAYDSDAAAMRQLALADVDDARRKYAALSVAGKRAYAAANPDFVATSYSPLPEHIGFQIADARAAGDHDLAHQLGQDFLAQANQDHVASVLATRKASWAYRLTFALLYALLGLVVSGLCAGVGYVAAGQHGAVLGATPGLLVTAIVILIRMGGSRR